MKHLYVLALLLSIASNSIAQQQEITEKQIKFVNKFIEAVHDHNAKKVIKLMDKSYRTDQIAFLGGNKEQFVNELFGGVDQLAAEYTYINTKFLDIIKIEVAEVIPLDDGNFNYIFRIRDGQHDILKSLLLVVKPKYGLVGASG